MGRKIIRWQIGAVAISVLFVLLGCAICAWVLVESAGVEVDYRKQYMAILPNLVCAIINLEGVRRNLRTVAGTREVQASLAKTIKVIEQSHESHVNDPPCP